MTIINHQRRRNLILAPRGYESDHIIPYCICKDDSKENIQFLKIKDHRIKSIIDKKIIKEFKKKGWIEKVTNYSHELKVPINKLKKEYLKQVSKVSKVSR